MRQHPLSAPGDDLPGERGDEQPPILAELRDQRPPVVVIERPGPRRDLLDLTLRVLAGLVLALVVVLLAALFLITLAVASQVTSLGGSLSAVAEQTGRSLDRTVQGLADRFDPAHPPRDPLPQDAEFDELRLVPVGSAIGRTDEYLVTLVDVRRRSDARGPDEAQYAVVQRRLETPRPRTVLGVVVGSDADEAEYFLYKGESFRLGRATFKVNWVSLDRQEVAIARYRSADGLTTPLKFELD